MGACFNCMELDGKLSMDEVITKFNERVEQDGYESGHSYSGSFSEFSGLTFHNKVFNTYDEGSDYVEEHGVKWGPAVCVRYHHAEPSKMLLKHDAARAKLKRKIWDAEAYLGEAKRSTKPAYVTKAEEKLERIKESVQPKIYERTEKIVAIRQALGAKSKDVRWYLGGWCSS